MSLNIVPKKIRESICSGCLTYYSSYECKAKPIKNGKKCPCSVCLVKMRCVTPCDLFYNYKKRYSGFQSCD